ncbi:MAG: aldose 1-epimerase family protein [Bifidobacterium sp.]|jgi:aldose 1-epimerase|nr:aldose 1-epimerase family protein [Bifidobacterium sp.]MCI1864351.1 aldose 1-epimerase family protein [Bifidobacterium sp.]
MSTPRKPRTGNQYAISAGQWRATVTELGASLRRLTWKGRDIVVPFDPDRLIPCSNGWILTPYPNRVKDGSYEFNGTTYQMPIDEVDRHTALHGYSYRYMWKLEDLGESHVTLSWRAPDLAGYPFDITVTATYALSERGLSQTVRVHNDDSVEAPWAFGIHPWLSNGGHATGDAIDADNDRCRVELHCARHVTVDARLLPTGEEPVDGTPFDLRSNPALLNHVFDDAWTGVERDAHGGTSAVFTRPDGLKVTLTGDETINAWQICTGTGFPEGIHQAGVAVEPMTAYADAFRSGKNLVRVRPGEDYATTITYRAEDI